MVIDWLKRKQKEKVIYLQMRLGRGRHLDSDWHLLMQKVKD